jgi:tRNA threonylcarbamoyladenosine biosynthesis protein TsaB
VDSIESLVAIAHAKHLESSICSTIDARRMEVFSTIYNKNHELLKPLSADIIDETIYDAFAPFMVVGDGTSKLKEIWKGKNIQFDEEIISSAQGQIEIAFNKFNHSDFEDLAYFEPKYLKDFVGTKSKKKSF